MKQQNKIKLMKSTAHTHENQKIFIVDQLQLIRQQLNEIQWDTQQQRR